MRHRTANTSAEQRTSDFMISRKAARPNVHAGPSRQARWQAENPKARWAHIALQSALRRKLINREPCAVCGAEKGDGHHDKYDMPIAVTWLCRRHHIAAHKRERNEPEQAQAKRAHE